MCRDRERPDVSATLELELDAVPDAVTGARTAITELCRKLDVDDDVADRIRVAVTEAAANCVLHAYPPGEVGATYMVGARVDDGALCVVVHDCGSGILHEPRRNAGLGLGLRLIDALSDRATVSSRPGHGTRVVMRFELRSADTLA
jgi:stage II sporulation protein AB (anti-sigma F factor)